MRFLHFDNRLRALFFFSIFIPSCYFLVLMHLPLYNAGGYGIDLPQNLIAWIIALISVSGIWFFLPWKKLRVTSAFCWVFIGVVFLTLPVFWSPQKVWLIARAPSLFGMWAAVLVYFTLLQCRFTVKQSHCLLALIALSATIEAVIVLIDIYAGGLPSSFARALLHVHGRGALGTFQQMNVTASFLATGFLLSMLLFARNGMLSNERQDICIRRRITSDSVLIFCLFTISVALVLLQSRTGWIGAVVGFVLVNVLLWRQGELSIPRRRILWLLPLLGIMAGIILLHLPGAPSADHSESNLQRWLTLKVTWSMIKIHPLQGWGLGSFAYVFQHTMAEQPGGNPGGELMLHPHNEIFYQWMEGGGAGLIGCILIVLAIITIIRSRLSSPVLAGWVALIPIIIHTQTEFPLYYSVGHVLTLVVIVACIDRSKKMTIDFGRHPLALCLGKMTVQSIVIYFLWLLATSLIVGFTLSRFESQVPGAEKEIKMISPPPWIIRSRYDYDMNILKLMEFNKYHDKSLLEYFLRDNSHWLLGRMSPNAYYNQALVLHYLARDKEGRRWFNDAGQLFPWDKRFGKRVSPE